MNKLQEVTAEAAKEVVAAFHEIGINANECRFKLNARRVFMAGPELSGSFYLDYPKYSGNSIIKLQGETIGGDQLSSVVESLKSYVDAVSSTYGTKNASLYVDLYRSHICTSNDLVVQINKKDLRGLNWLQEK